jgi:hypothetical protein
MKDLIPIAYLNDACFLSLNTDDKKYRMCLKMAQEDLQDIIGNTFYAEIESQYPKTLSTDNSTFYEDCVKDFLAWRTYFNYLKFANVDATPTGIRTFNDENSSLASDIQMYSLEKHVRAQAEKYKYRIQTFLTEAQSGNSGRYPLYSHSCLTDMSFAITSVSGKSDLQFRIEKSIITNS